MVLFLDEVLNNLYLFSEELVLFVEEIECLDVFLFYLFKHVVNFFQQWLAGLVLCLLDG